MQKQATLLALFAIIFALFVSSPSVQAAAEDKEAYGTGMLLMNREKKKEKQKGTDRFSRFFSKNNSYWYRFGYNLLLCSCSKEWTC